jgi:hypothetical protein
MLAVLIHGAMFLVRVALLDLYQLTQRPQLQRGEASKTYVGAMAGRRLRNGNGCPSSMMFFAL